MRQIKFRAWCEGNMYSAVDMFHSHDGGIECVKIGYIKNPSAGKKTKAIENVELMQFTGLQDKNGVDIYEGDIVEYKIKISQSRMGKWHKDIVSMDGCFPDFLKNKFGCNYRVVGNIHENPELLEA